MVDICAIEFLGVRRGEVIGDWPVSHDVPLGSPDQAPDTCRNI